MARQRTLPHALDAEASVLGAVLIRPQLLARLETLEVDQFYDHKHRAVFQAMRNLEHAQRPVDITTVEVEIAKQGKLEAVGGVAFLGQLALHVPTVDNAVEYARIVQDKARCRALMLVAGDIVERGYQPDVEAEEFFDDALAKITRLDRARPDQTITASELVRRRLAEHEQIAQARARGEVALVGIPTGIAALDKRIGGYPLGDLTIIAARPAMGKTAQAMACSDAATAAGDDVHVFSNEGGWRMYADRLLSRGSGLPVEKIRAGELETAEDAAALAKAVAKYRSRDNWALDDRANLTASEIIRAVRARKAKRKAKKTVAVVDYVQTLRRTRGMSENEALDEIITAFAQAALADDVSYVVLSQLNREVEKRVDKRPQTSDLRGSGALEERARLIVSPYRGSHYYEEPKEGIDYDCACFAATVCGHKPDEETFKRTVQVLVLKNNNGQTGRVFATWNAPTTEMY